MALALITSVLVLSPGTASGSALDDTPAPRELRALAEHLAIPVMTSLPGKSCFDETHPLALGSGGNGINGGRIHGGWPGFEEDDLFPGPGGLKHTIDYRSVLSEVLSGAMGNPSVDRVFPGFSPQPVGLVG